MNGPSDSDLRTRWNALVERTQLARQGHLPVGVATPEQFSHLNRIEYEAIWREWEELLDHRRAGTLTDDTHYLKLVNAVQDAVKIHGYLLSFSHYALDSPQERAAFIWIVRLDEIEMLGDADEARWAKLYPLMRQETQGLSFVLEHPSALHWATNPLGITWRIDTMVWSGPTRVKI